MTREERKQARKKRIATREKLIKIHYKKGTFLEGIEEGTTILRESQIKAMVSEGYTVTPVKVLR